MKMPVFCVHALRRFWPGRLMLLPLALAFFLLCGCGTSYLLSVDSLRDPVAAAPAAEIYQIEPAQADTAPDDLLFREMAAMLEPAFRARGYRLTLQEGPEAAPNAGATTHRADRLARLSFKEGEPRTVVVEGTRSRLVTVRTRRGYERIFVDEPTLSAHTRYSASLLLEGYERGPKGERGRQIWRTRVECESNNKDFRAMIARMLPVLSETLGTHTGGLREYLVRVDEKGVASVKSMGE